jgi:hypothetical protein
MPAARPRGAARQAGRRAPRTSLEPGLYPGAEFAQDPIAAITVHAGAIRVGEAIHGIAEQIPSIRVPPASGTRRKEQPTCDKHQA